MKVHYRMTRTFHPIGQGAFYTERHNDFTLVYDCGAMPLTKYAKSVVKSAFVADEDIDVLFISHFDYDHVSAISTLNQTVRKIKRVVMPLLDEEHKNLLININRALSQNIVKLISDPQSFFGKDTDIIYVRPANGEQSEPNNDFFFDLREIGYHKDKDTGAIEVESGSKLSFGGELRWIFAPYNFLNITRSSQLIAELSNANFDVAKLKTDPFYTINQITTVTQRKELRKAYAKVDGNVNENSMLLYSGPESINREGMWCICNEYYDHCRWPEHCIYKVGCIYTGDCDLNKINLGIVYADLNLNVGTIQIPHHGSKHNFSIQSLSDFWPHIFCPISYGTKNNYGHPAAEVVNKLSQQGFRPLLVNEQSSSEFEQKFTILNKSARLTKHKVGIF
ncbi:MBL fold metallo-hydrolase [Aliikangiella sp. IMCC44632]